MACRFPKADSPSEFWANILNKKDCITEIPESHWSVEDYYANDPKAPDMTYAKKGGFINQVAFDPLKYSIPPAALEATDTSQLLGMVVAHEALIDAGYRKDRPLDRNRVSVILGVTGALELVIPLGARLGHPIWRKALLEAGISPERAEDIVEKISSGYVPWQENSFPGLLGNVVAGRIANALDLGGTNCVVDAACASSLSAVHLACMELQSGRTDLALTGGIDTFNDIFMYMCFSKTPALSPSGEASPFSATGDGTILGEGLGVVALKRWDDALRDGDHVYAVIRGLGSSSDGKGNAIYAPSAAGQKKALERAYQMAAVTPATLELVEGHGTGTKVGDATEASALAEVFGESQEGPWCALGSVKSQIGHTKAAAGIAGVMKAALALHRKVLPPTLKAENPVDVLQKPHSPLYLNSEARPWPKPASHPRRAAVSAFGFGGSNFHCVLEEASPEKTITDWDGLVQIIAFSGKNRSALDQQLAQWQPSQNWAEIERFAAKTRKTFSPESPHRLLLVVECGKTQLIKIRDNARNLLTRYADKAHWDAPEGIVYGSGERRGKLGVLFPGQGSQYVGMFRDLACRFPEFQEVLEELNQVAPDLTETDRSWRFSDLLYPIPAMNEAEKEAQKERLTRTQIAQPAIGAVSIGALEVVRRFGVEPQAVAGHSFGEITALCASGRFQEDAFYMLSRLRGRLMAMGEGDKGAMLAVRATQNVINGILQEHGLDLVMANKNAPDQTVLSGATHEIARASKVLNQKQIRHKRLPVAAAFHSSLVGQAREPFYAELSKLDFPKAKIPVYANATAEIYPDDPAAARDLLANQLLKPVEFVDEILAMHKDGVHTFLEIGPGARLTGLVKSILKDHRFEAFALDASSGKRSGLYDLARVLAHLAGLGYPVTLPLWENGGPAEDPLTGKNKMTVWLSGANHKSKNTLERAEKPIPKIVPEPAVPVSAPQLSEARRPPVLAAPSSAHSPRSFITQPTQDPQVVQPMVSNSLRDALAVSAQQLEMLQQIQAQTAALHQQFLSGQEAAQRTMAALIQQQQSMLSGQPFVPVSSQNQRAVPPQKLPVPTDVQTRHQTPAVQVPSPVQAQTSPKAQAKKPATQPALAVPEKAAIDTSVESILLQVLSEKTGYPADMLELDMQLDADLGVDSIKRVEILSAVQESLPNLEPVPPEELGRLHTLRDVVTLLGPSPQAGLPKPAQPSQQVGPQAKAVLMAVVSEKTGYPADMLEPGMQLDADLGIDSIKRVEILSALQAALPQAPEFKPEEMGELNSLADILAKLDALPAMAPSTQPVSAVPHQEISSHLLRVVAEKTGYPEEMLEPQMQLDADLGIDSIKRVEILSAVQEAFPSLPTVPAEDISQMQTLADIVTFMSAAIPQTTSQPVGSNASADSATSVLLEIIAEKTGYPVDMLEPGMSLEADLGIDSIKRVEILSSLSEALPHLPEIKAEMVGDFHTLADIIHHLGESTPASKGKASDNELWVNLLTIVAEKTGYPADMLEAGMSLEADLGIDSIKRVEILSALQDVHADLPQVVPDEMGQLQTLGEIRAYFQEPNSSVVHSTAAKTDLIKASPAKSLPEPQRQETVVSYCVEMVPVADQGAVALEKGSCIWLTQASSPWGQALSAVLEARDFEIFAVPEDANPSEKDWPTPAGLILLAPQERQPSFAKEALFLAQKAAPTLMEKAGSSGSLFASISWLGGDFALTSYLEGANPYEGALAGLVKTAALEWQGVHCRAIDLAPATVAVDLAEQMVNAVFAKGQVELGIKDAVVRTPELTEVPPARESRLPLAAGDVVVVTGGARGVTAACLMALADEVPLRLALLGRSEAPEVEEPAWLTGLSNEQDIRKALIQRLDPRPAPKEIATMAASLMRQREIRQTLACLREKGCEVLYFQVDVNHPEAVKTIVNEVRAAWGCIAGFIHGAGVLADKLIVDKTEAQFELVWQTKVTALENLLEGLVNEPLKLLGLFSSSTARFGRKGQVDYAMANETMNKIGAEVKSQRPNCRVMSWNWGPWAGGMVTPDLEKVFASEGIDLIPLRAGAQALVSGLSRPVADASEWVVLGGPLPVASPQVNAMDLHLVFEKTMSLEQLPFLKGHAMNDRGVMPMAMMLEWLAHTAITEVPGLNFSGLEDFRVFKAMTFGPHETMRVQFLAGNVQKSDGTWRIPVALASKDGKRIHHHARGIAVLTNTNINPPSPSLSRSEELYTKTIDEVYGMLFHREPFRAIQDVTTYSDEGITARALGAPQPREWMTKPLRSRWLSDPLIIDSAFQLMVLWCIERYGIPSLPTYFGSYWQYGPIPQGAEVEVVVRITGVSFQKVSADMEFRDTGTGALLAALSGYECVMDSGLNQAFRRNLLPEEVHN